MQNYINTLEASLYNDEELAAGKFMEYMDIDSYIDWWFVHELVGIWEPNHPKSTYMVKDKLGKLKAGPAWDFDWGTFSFNASPHAQWGLFIQWAWWYDRLFQDEEFKALASQRWATLKPRFEQIFDYIALSWQRNFAMWNISTDINGDENLSFQAAIDRMSSITRQRIDIIDQALR